MHLQVSQLQGRHLDAKAAPAIFNTWVVFTKKWEPFPRGGNQHLKFTNTTTLLSSNCLIPPHTFS